MSKELFAYIKCMSLSAFVGQDILKLHQKVGLASLCDFNDDDWRRVGVTENFIACWRRVSDVWISRQMKWLRAHPEVKLLKLGDKEYPELLAQIKYPPLYLFVYGDVSVLSKQQIAIVGSRKASKQGLETAKRFAREFAKADLVVTSGLALGVDGAAHIGALQGNGETIAVLGTGVGSIYPKKHQTLADHISKYGAVISEFPPLAPPNANHFPVRNRIISGLSRGTLVVEAAKRSGSLITAREAADQGREVFAIPGSIVNPNMQGANMLLQQGAHLAQQPEDVLDVLKLLPKCDHAVEKKPKPHPLFQYFDDAPTAMELIVERSGLSPAEVGAELLQLELEGRVAREPSGFQILRY